MAGKTPLARVKNIGPVTLPELEALGFRYIEDLEAAGFEEVCRRWVQHFPKRLNANAFLGVMATLEGVVWTQASPAMKAAARSLAKRMRAELGVKSKR
jgi:hypothetical protein